jgi:uncharacterized membrane protein
VTSQPPSPPPGWPEPRIGDVEREGAAWALGEHFAAGRLTQEEYDERAGLAWQAKTHSDLAPLFGDLPQPHGRPTAARTVAQPPVRRQPAPRRHPWHPWLALLVALFVLGAIVEKPVLVILLVVALVVFVKKRRARRRANPPGR